MVKRILIPCDPEFVQLTRRLKGEMSLTSGERISDRQMTKHLARFMQEEGLDKILARRVEYRRRKGGVFF